MSLRDKTRVLILGGGFGGVATAQGLQKHFKRDPSVEVTLVNRDNYFVFVPMLASAAAGSIETLHVVAPIRRLIPGVNFRAEEVTGINLEGGFVETAAPVTGREHRLFYDHLVLALGNVIDLQRLPQHGKTIKTLGDALAIRNHVLRMLEAADIETDPVTRREMLGRGAGVGELAGGIKVKGVIGWFLWRSVYWSRLPSFGRKVQIWVGWFLDLFLKRDIAQINLSRTQTVGRTHHEAGEYLLRQGDPGDHVYMIAGGEVEMIRERSSGERNVLAGLGKGDYFGETALLTNGRLNASVRCVTPVDVITIRRDDFAALAGAWRQLSEDLEKTSERRVSMAPLTTFLPVVDLAGIPEVARRNRGPLSSPRAVARLERETGGELTLDRDLVTLGRGDDNHVVVADQAASRRHALIQKSEDGTYWIDDLGSSNGTWVNRNRVSGCVAHEDGDEIFVGGTRFVFQLAPEAVRHPPAPSDMGLGAPGRRSD